MRKQQESPLMGRKGRDMSAGLRPRARLTCDTGQHQSPNMDYLHDAILAAVDDARAPVTLHLGRDADDLQQLSHLARHLPALAAAFEAAGEQADAP